MEKHYKLGLLILGLSLSLVACNETPDYALVDDRSSEEANSMEESSEEEVQEKKTVAIFEEKNYVSDEIDDPSLEEGQKRVLQEGVTGQSEITYEITYVNGEEVSRLPIQERIIKKSVPEIIARGTGVAYVESQESIEESSEEEMSTEEINVAEEEPEESSEEQVQDYGYEEEEDSSSSYQSSNPTRSSTGSSSSSSSSRSNFRPSSSSSSSQQRPAPASSSEPEPEPPASESEPAPEPEPDPPEEPPTGAPVDEEALEFYYGPDHP